VNFFYEGGGEMSVKVFYNESCCIQYHRDNSGDNSTDDPSDGSEEDEGQQNL
jgi:hypothetical protein